MGGVLLMILVYSSGYLFIDPADFHLGFVAALYNSVVNSFWSIGILMVIISLLIGAPSKYQI